MKAVLRIVHGFFSFLPLQGWANAVGAVLLAIGLPLILRASDTETATTMTFAIALPGACLMVLLPLTLGGVALRFASSRSLLHLRPHGRASMLLGSTLTLALMATLVTLPVVAQYHVFTKFGIRHVPHFTPPTQWFVLISCCATGAWLLMFACSSSRWLTVLMPMLLPVTTLSVSGMHSSASWRLASQAVLAAWVAFALWYLRVARIKRPDWMSDRGPVGFGGLAIRPLERLSSVEGGSARVRALRQYLFGSESRLANIAVGASVAMLVLGITALLPAQFRVHSPPVFYLFPFTFAATTVGQMSATRARHLWLRAGIDRSGLFGVAERSGLPPTLLMFGAGAVILLVASIIGRPEQALHVVLYVAILGILDVALFYFGLSLTRGWNAADVFRGVGLFLLAVFMQAVILGAIKSQEHPSAAGILIPAGVFVLLGLLLRRFARRRWRVLDWRVAKLPRTVRA